MVLARAVPILLLSCLAACGGAKAKAKVSTSAEAEAEVDFDKEGAISASGENESGDSASNDSDSAAKTQAMEGATQNKGVKFGPPALLGARHDVRLSEPGQKVACRCLAVVYGSSGMPGLTWSDLPPKLDDGSQTLVVIESEGVPCDDTKAPGASYMGYHKDGDNVVIDVESAHPGRPVTRGAVVPKPGPGGQIVIAAPKGLPYGRALQGDGKCML